MKHFLLLALLVGVAAMPGLGADPAPAKAATATTALNAELRGLLGLHNKRRAALGERALRADPRLNAAAAQHAAWMAAHRTLSHTGPGGSTAVTRAAAQGYTGRSYAIAENIADGQRTTAEVFTAWVASVGHRHNIDNAVYQDIGIGVATAADGARYWAVTFGKIGP